MMLKDLIQFLKTQDANRMVPVGFSNPHSYRGYYDELAFEPEGNITVGAMLDCAESALGRTFSGWKGGDFVMREYTPVWLANEGECGEGLGIILLRYMVGEL